MHSAADPECGSTADLKLQVRDTQQLDCSIQLALRYLVSNFLPRLETLSLSAASSFGGCGVVTSTL